MLHTALFKFVFFSLYFVLFIIDIAWFVGILSYLCPSFDIFPLLYCTYSLDWCSFSIGFLKISIYFLHVCRVIVIPMHIICLVVFTHATRATVQSLFEGFLLMLFWFT